VVEQERHADRGPGSDPRGGLEPTLPGPPADGLGQLHVHRHQHRRREAPECLGHRVR